MHLNSMKKFLFIVSLSILSGFTMNIDAKTKKIIHSENGFSALRVIDLTKVNQENELFVKDCTIKVNIESESGTTIQGEITFVDISWWECTKIKIATFLNNMFD